jgi:restriction system protein
MATSDRRSPHLLGRRYFTRPNSKRRKEERHLKAAMGVYMLQKRELARLAMENLTVSSIVIPEKKLHTGTLIASTSIIWGEIVNKLRLDWSLAASIPPHMWEEIIAGAFKKAGFNEVTLTPRSGDHGRDIIAIKHGFGCIKIIDSVKAYKPGHLVGYDDVRALLGVLSGEQDASKAIITTTSGFPPKIGEDPFIARFLPTRLELMDGPALQTWLGELA